MRIYNALWYIFLGPACGWGLKGRFGFKGVGIKGWGVEGISVRVGLGSRPSFGIYAGSEQVLEKWERVYQCSVY